MNTNTINVEIITNEEGLAALQIDWQALAADLPSNTDFYASWDYVWCYVRFHQPANWFVVSLRDSDTQQLLAVFPLQSFQINANGPAFKACQPLGPSQIPYVEFPMRSLQRREVIQALLNTALREQLGIDVVLFWPLHETSALHLVLVEDFGKDGALTSYRYAKNLHEIETRGQSFETYFQSKRSSLLRDSRYRERRLGKEGRVEVTMQEPIEQMSELVKQLCQWNLHRYTDQHVYRHRPQWSAFMPELVSALARQGLAEVSTLRLDGRVICSTLSFAYKSRRYFHLYDSDPGYKKYSPAKVLLSHLIRRAFDQSEVFCFGSGDYDYKRDWAQSVGELKADFVYLNSAARLALASQLNAASIHLLGGV